MKSMGYKVESRYDTMDKSFFEVTFKIQYFNEFTNLLLFLFIQPFCELKMELQNYFTLLFKK